MSPELTAQRARQQDEDEREDALRIASRLMTGREDPHVVLPVADHLLTWMRDETRPGTTQSRHRAMMRQFLNIRSDRFDNDPDGFLKAAALYVPFLTAGEVPE